MKKSVKVELGSVDLARAVQTMLCVEGNLKFGVTYGSMISYSLDAPDQISAVAEFWESAPHGGKEGGQTAS